MCRDIKFHSPNIQLSSNNAKKAAINYYYYSRDNAKKKKRQWEIHQWAFISSATKQIFRLIANSFFIVYAAQIKEERDENIKIIAKKLEINIILRCCRNNWDLKCLHLKMHEEIQFLWEPPIRRSTKLKLHNKIIFIISRQKHHFLK